MKKSEKIKLERATFDDIPIILEVEKSVIGTKIYSGLTGAEDAKTELTNDIYYLIKSGDNVVGNTSYQLKDDESAYISGLVVTKKFQGQGIGKRAMQMLLEILKDKKIIWLMTHPENVRAIALYKSLGFKQVGKPIENYFDDGEPRIKMILEK